MQRSPATDLTLLVILAMSVLSKSSFTVATLEPPDLQVNVSNVTFEGAHPREKLVTVRTGLGRVVQSTHS